MMNLETRTPPHDLAIERSFLGWLLLKPELLVDVMNTVSPHHLYDPFNRAAYHAMMTLYEQKSPADLVSIQAEMKKAGWRDEGGDAFEMLVDLMDTFVYAVGDLHYYANLILDLFRRREVIQHATRLCVDAYDREKVIEEVVTGYQSKMLDAISHSQEQDQNVLALVEAMMSDLDRRMSGGGAGVPTGFIDLDRWIGGMEPGDLILLAARPSVGKSTMAMNMMYNIARVSGVPCGFQSIEMPPIKIIRNLACRISRVNGLRFRRGELNDRELEKIHKANELISKLPISVMECQGMNIDQLRNSARHLRARENIGVLFVDHIHEVAWRPGGSREYEEVTHIAAGMKQMARELDIPVVALSQFSRKGVRLDDEMPRKEDLRGTGALEEKADVILIMHPADKELNGPVKVRIEKQRDGPTVDFQLMFFRSECRFENHTERASYADKTPGMFR